MFNRLRRTEENASDGKAKIILKISPILYLYLLSIAFFLSGSFKASLISFVLSR
jgi:hypothetical protein